MRGCELLEYRPGYYAWVDAGGAVIRKATETEADQVLAQLAGRAAAVADLPLFAVENTAPTDQAAPSTAPAAELPTERRPSKGKPKPNGNGGGPAARLASDPAGQALTEPTDQVVDQAPTDQVVDQAPPEAPAAMASGNGDQAPEVVPEVSGNGNGPVFFVAYRDHGDEMIPTSTAGRLLVYPTLEDARADSGALGVGSAQRWPGIVGLARRHGLALPEVGGNGDRAERGER